MNNLKTEYTDAKARLHKVEHTVVAAGDSSEREEIIEELFRVMLKGAGRLPA